MMLMGKNVISIVGMIGTGKTSVINELSRRGYPVLQEEYMSSKIRFDNRLSISKWSWVGNWFNNLYDFFTENPHSHFVFTDRNALEAGIWTPTCYSFMSPLERSFSEMGEMGFKFVNICLFCNNEILNERIQSRLILEPYRKDYNEANDVFINTLNNSYESNKDLWDYKIDTSEKSVNRVCDAIIDYINYIL